MISRGQLLEALRARRVSEWVVIERIEEIAIASDSRRRTDKRTRLSMLVHQDFPRGRGSARLEVGALDGKPYELVDRALAFASMAVGPIWRSTPPAVPARVDIADPALEKVALDEAATEVLRAMPHPTGATVTSSIEMQREWVRVHTHAGLRTTWRGTLVRADVLVSLGDRSLDVTREARRLADLQLDGAIADAAADLARLETAGKPVPGRCALILRTDALLHGGGVGVWSVFADHATGEIERQGLSRYRLRTPIAPGADELNEPLTITSDGALPHATRSAPLGDDGDAVRRFALVERGISVGLGLSMREAARRQTDPNGGVRNLVVSSGTWSESAPPGRSLEVHRLRSLMIDPYTGDGTFEIGLAIDRDGGGERAITGGTVRLDLVVALARARRSAAPIRRGAYMGPSSILIEDVELVM